MSEEKETPKVDTELEVTPNRNPFVSNLNRSEGLPEALTEEDRERIRIVEEKLEELKTPNLEFSKKLDLIIEIQSEMIPPLLRESISIAPNLDKSNVIHRLSMVLKELTQTLNTKREAQITDNLDPYSPKFQAAFAWFAELFYEAVSEQDIDPIVINQIFQYLDSSLMGWEERLVKSLKGITAKSTELRRNPFVKGFVESLKEGSKEVEEKKEN